MNPAREIPISESQTRSMATSLALLDETLCLFEEYGNGREVHSVCYEERNRLTSRQRKALLAEIKRVREQMARMKRDLRLPTKVEDVGKRIWGHSAGFWETVAEMKSKRLRGYGEVSPVLAEYLDAMVQRLLEQLQRISSITGGGNGSR